MSWDVQPLQCDIVSILWSCSRVRMGCKSMRDWPLTANCFSIYCDCQRSIFFGLWTIWTRGHTSSRFSASSGLNGFDILTVVRELNALKYKHKKAVIWWVGEKSSGSVRCPAHNFFDGRRAASALHNVIPPAVHGVPALCPAQLYLICCYAQVVSQFLF